MTRKNQLAESVEQKPEAREVKRVKTNWVRLDGSVPSIYANQVELHATNWDFRFRFGEAFDIQTENATVTGAHTHHNVSPARKSFSQCTFRQRAQI